MKNLKSKRGPFAERPYYENDEIDRICIEELRAVDLYPRTPAPIRIDRFIEKRFKVTHSYEDLGVGILGLTKFGKQGVKEVVIAQALDAQSTVSSERLVRSTLAHEAGHGLLHTHLFVFSGECSLFPEGMGMAPKVLCRGEGQQTNSRQYTGEWWEYQANRAIGGLLLPRPLLLVALEDCLISDGTLGLKTLDESRRNEATRHAADVFDVNPAAVAIRVNEIFPIQTIKQLML